MGTEKPAKAGTNKNDPEMPPVFVVENLFVAQMTRKCTEVRLRMLTTSSQWRENSGVLLCSTRALSPPSGQFKNNQLQM